MINVLGLSELFNAGNPAKQESLPQVPLHDFHRVHTNDVRPYRECLRRCGRWRKSKGLSKHTTTQNAGLSTWQMASLLKRTQQTGLASQPRKQEGRAGSGTARGRGSVPEVIRVGYRQKPRHLGGLVTQGHMAFGGSPWSYPKGVACREGRGAPGHLKHPWSCPNTPSNFL